MSISSSEYYDNLIDIQIQINVNN